MENNYWEVASAFMKKLKVGDSFTLNNKNYCVKCTGKWKPKESSSHNHFKTLTVKCQETNTLINFFYFFGNENISKRNSIIRQHQFVRDVEGALKVDLLNQNNPLHRQSDMYRMATA